MLSLKGLHNREHQATRGTCQSGIRLDAERQLFPSLENYGALLLQIYGVRISVNHQK